jgi:hypothetical protein
LIPLAKIPITERIYLGDIESTKDIELLKRLDIECIINISDCHTDEYITHEGMNYLIISDLSDNPKEPIYKWFPIVNKFIKDNTPRRILIHCMNAVSHSVTLVLAYLINELKLNLYDAYNYLYDKRKTQYSKPNRGFMKQLINYEREQLGTSSLTIHNFIILVERKQLDEI